MVHSIPSQVVVVVTVGYQGEGVQRLQRGWVSNHHVKIVMVY